MESTHRNKDTHAISSTHTLDLVLLLCTGEMVAAAAGLSAVDLLLYCCAVLPGGCWKLSQKSQHRRELCVLFSSVLANMLCCTAVGVQFSIRVNIYNCRDTYAPFQFLHRNTRVCVVWDTRDRLQAAIISVTTAELSESIQDVRFA